MWSSKRTELMTPSRSIRGRTVLLAAALIVLGVASAVVATGTQLTVKSANERVVAQRAIQVQVEALEIGMVNQQTALRGYALTGRTDFLQPYDLGRQQVAAAEQALDRVVPGDRTYGSYQLMKKAANDWEGWAESQTAQIEAQGAGAIEVTDALADKQLFDAFRTAANGFEHATDMEVTAAQAAAQQQSQAFLVLVPALGLGGLIVLLLLISLFFGSTLRPLGQLIDTASALARGESVAIPRPRRLDEVGVLARALAAWQVSTQERLALAQSMLQLTEEVDMASVLELGLQRLREVLGAEAAVVIVRNDQGLELAAARPHAFTIPWRAEGVAGLDLWGVEQALCTDLVDSAPHPALVAWADEQRLGPALVAPLVSAGHPLGAVLVARRRGLHPFGASDVQLAQVIVGALGAAIHVSRLFMDLTTANADLERASRVKNQFVANMSHELRTPLNSVLGFAQLLQSGDFGELNARQQRYVEHIVSSGRQLLELINDVLDLSKIEAGKLAMMPERTDLQVLVDECVAKMRPVAAAKGVRMQAEVAEGLEVWADPRRLRQVLLNLLSNAVKFTPERGLIEIWAGPDDGAVCLEVSDTGIGIAPDHLAIIFDEFTQIDSTLSRQSAGSGLGLPLSRRLVEIMGGGISVESRPGEGSRFSVRLPAVAALQDAVG